MAISPSKGLHSSTSRLDVSVFCGIHCMIAGFH
jgi:hypothetical protein